MKRTMIILLVLSLAIIAVISCSEKDDDPVEEIKDNCNLRVEDYPTVELSYTLKANWTGDATVSRFIYKTVDKTDTRYNPSFPWEKGVLVAAATNFHF